MRLLLCMFLLTAIAPPALADNWTNTTQSGLTFVVKAQDAELTGRFAAFDLTLTTVADNNELESFEVIVNLAATDMGDHELNAMLVDVAWFDSNKYPTAIFKTTNITEKSNGLFETEGKLSLKGVKKTLNFPVQFVIDGDSASVKGSTPINRSDFHVGSGDWASDDTVGFTVDLTFDVPLSRAR